ncbi:MAG: aldehyde dehydrogenase family protein, partial [Woeseiaceae bacterium]|nr:aldehyde dehydrogenase family protein [Woeseiaceae bacterium]
AAYGSCGERCMAISVAVCVGDETADAVVSKLKHELAGLKVGAGTDTSNNMGPLITKAHHDKVRGYVDLGVEEGADLVVDGRSLVVDGHEHGFFLGPCLFDRVTPEMRIYQEEIFGPVLCVVRAQSEEQAMQMIDDHEYGNGTCIFTRDGEAARYFADNIKVGMVGINVPLPVPVAYHSFGGWKRSLFGDLYAYGPDSVRFYTRRKTITQRWPAGGVREKAQFSFPSHS